MEGNELGNGGLHEGGLLPSLHPAGRSLETSARPSRPMVVRTPGSPVRTSSWMTVTATSSHPRSTSPTTDRPATGRLGMRRCAPKTDAACRACLPGMQTLHLGCAWPGAGKSRDGALDKRVRSPLFPVQFFRRAVSREQLCSTRSEHHTGSAPHGSHARCRAPNSMARMKQIGWHTHPYQVPKKSWGQPWWKRRGLRRSDSLASTLLRKCSEYLRVIMLHPYCVAQSTQCLG